MKKILSFLVAVMVLLTGVVPAWDFLENEIHEAKAANNLYVATTGADSSNCQTEGSPCATINYAISQASSGDDIYVAAGTYDEKVDCDGKSIDFIGADRDTTIIAPSATGTAVYLKPEADIDMTFSNFKVVPSSNSYWGIEMHEQTSGSWVTMTVDNVWVDQAKVGIVTNGGAWNNLYNITNSLITRPKQQGILNTHPVWNVYNRIVDSVDNTFIWSDGTQDSGYYCMDQINTVTNSMCTGTYGGIKFDAYNAVGRDDPYFANNYVMNVPYNSFYINNYYNHDKKCGAIINNTSIGSLDYSARIDCYTSAEGDEEGLLYNNFFMDGRYGVDCAGGTVNYGNNAFQWTWWEGGSDKDGYEGSCNTDGDIDTSNTYHGQNESSTSPWPYWEYEEDGNGDDMTWTIASHTAYTVTVTPDPGWTDDEWVGRWMTHQDVSSYMPWYIIDNDSDTLTVASDDIQSFSTMNLNSNLTMDDGDWIKIFDESFPQIGMSSNLIDTGMDPVDILTATEYTYVQDSYNGQARPFDAKSLGAEYTQWDRGASERYYEKSVFNQPTVSTPTATGYNVDEFTVSTSTAAGEDYATHDSSDWRLCTDLACNNVVWSISNDSTNLTSYTFTGTGALSGLDGYTQHYISVRYDNSVGSSSWSDPYSFWTAVSDSTDSVTWDFDEANPASYYTYTDSIIQVGSGNSYAELVDLGGGIYTGVGPDGNSKLKQITINNSGSELTNQQVQLTVTYDSDMQSDFDDLRFTTSGGTDIDYYLASKSDGVSATVWVEVPTLAASGDTVINMYYGNASLSSESSFDNTMTDDFSGESGLLGQWLYDEGSGSSVEDSSTNSYTGTITDATWYGSDAAFSTGDSLSFDGSGGDRMDISFDISDNLNGDFTLETWAMVDDSGDSWGWFFGETSGTFLFGKQSGSAKLHYNMDGIGSNGNIGSYTTGAWHHFVLTHDKSEASAFKIYIDGDLAGTYNEQNAGASAGGNVRIGSRSNGETLDGQMDETRIYNAYMTESQVDSHYAHAKYSSAVGSPSFGSEQAAADLDSVSVTLSSGQGYEELFSISHILGGTNEGSVYYQLSRDSSTWYYHTGTGWAAVSDDSTDKNTVSEMNSYLPALVTEVGTGSFYFKAFLESSGTQKVEIDSITLAYDGGAPSGLADFAFDSSTATTATFTWTPAVDGAFDHYEIWYGTDQSDVQGRTGTALEWDDGDEGDLATASTGTGTITGLSAGVDYYAKIWAVDAFGYESTLDDISFNTNQSPTASSVTASVATDGSGDVTIGFVGDDADDDTLSAKVEYNVGTGWAAATLKSTVTATNGTPTIDNDSSYQIETIPTSSGANTIGVTWDSSEDVENADTSSAQIRVTTYDSIADSTAATSSTFTFDQAAPSGLGSVTMTATDSNTIGVSWAAASDTNFTNYKVYYKKSTDSAYALHSTITSSSTTSATLTELYAGATYSAYVVATDDYGNTTTSPTGSVTTSADNPVFGQTTGGGSSASSASSTTTAVVTTDNDELAGEAESGDEDFDSGIVESTDEATEDSDAHSGEGESDDFVETPIIVPSEPEVVEPEVVVQPTPVVVEPEVEEVEEEEEEEEEEEDSTPATSVFVSTTVTEEVYEDEVVVTFHDSDDGGELRSIAIPVNPGEVDFRREFLSINPIYIVRPGVDKPSSYEDEEVGYDDAVDAIVDQVEDLVEAIEDDTGQNFQTKPENIIEEILEDEDGDGMLDVLETGNFGDTDSDGSVDTDGDGLTDAEELLAGSDPIDADSDNDGISDLVEVYMGTNPESWDSDGDGVSDTDEIVSGTDPGVKEVKDVDENIYEEDVDSDGDGMSDYMEAYYGTDPEDIDSDDDGISDMDELDYNLDPNSADYIEEVDTQITNIDDGMTSNDPEVTVKGTSSPNTTVVVYVFNSSGSYGGGAAPVSVVEITTDDVGKFVSVLPEDLVDGEYSLFLVSVDEKGRVEDLSPVADIQVDTEKEAPAVELKEFAGATTFGLGSKLATDNPRPKIRAISKPGAIIHVSWRSLIFTSVVVADSQTGEFEVQPPQDLEEDDHVAYIYAEDPETGVTGKTTQVNFSVTTDVLMHESAAQREAEDRFPYAYLLIAGLLAVGAGFVFVRRWRSDEEKMMSHLK